ncbi:MAG: aminomethyl-transferring glycine dehydrogenase subunit GcvPB, partial [Candidatus Omnitrophica bacterium]|nr:aminomethyl-transferring glycine dehydrogenase subunit GcvPB [Candidatus Omnitrophota bacterium]
MLISNDSRLSFEKSRPGRCGISLPPQILGADKDEGFLPGSLRRKRPLRFPELSEPEVIRHFVNLSKKNFAVDSHFYPLGSL